MTIVRDSGATWANFKLPFSHLRESVVVLLMNVLSLEVQIWNLYAEIIEIISRV